MKILGKLSDLILLIYFLYSTERQEEIKPSLKRKSIVERSVQLCFQIKRLYAMSLVNKETVCNVSSK